MTTAEPEFPGTPIPEYNHDGNSPTIKTPLSDSPYVIVPSDSPDFGPAAARALLRLLITVHRKRTAARTSGEEP